MGPATLRVEKPTTRPVRLNNGASVCYDFRMRIFQGLTRWPGNYLAGAAAGVIVVRLAMASDPLYSGLFSPAGLAVHNACWVLVAGAVNCFVVEEQCHGPASAYRTKRFCRWCLNVSVAVFLLGQMVAFSFLRAGGTDDPGLQVIGFE